MRSVGRALRRIFTIVAVLAAIGAGVIFMTGVGAKAHLDPLTAASPWTPNWALAAPLGVETEAKPVIETPIWRAGVAELLAGLDKIALAEPKTTRVAEGKGGDGNGAGDPRSRTYLQRSKLVGWPDYVSVKGVPMESGADGQRASLAIFSRSVYGISDRGVNRARVERWIAALDGMFDRAP